MPLLGVISDTHGLIRPEALAALQGAELILHAGDIGDPRVLQELRTLAPVKAVRGNVDTSPWALKLPAFEILDIGPLKIYLRHNLNEIRFDPSADGIRVMVTGHSHQPLIRERQGVLYLNPGSAGPRRPHLPVSIARLSISGEKANAEHIELNVD